MSNESSDNDVVGVQKFFEGEGEGEGECEVECWSSRLSFSPSPCFLNFLNILIGSQVTPSYMQACHAKTNL